MGEHDNSIPDPSLEALARSFFKETVHYGFTRLDYLRFVNHILELSLRNGLSGGKPHEVRVDYHAPSPVELPLTGDKVHVRKYDEEKDRLLFEAWMADDEGRYFLLSRVTACPVNIEQFLTAEENILGTITLQDGTPIGMVAFLDVDRAQRKAELRKMIGEPSSRGKGFAKEATQLWLRYGVTTLGLKKIYVNTLDNNFRNIHLNENLGFKVEGLLRSECLFNGEYHDILRMALVVE